MEDRPEPVLVEPQGGNEAEPYKKSPLSPTAAQWEKKAGNPGDAQASGWRDRHGNPPQDGSSSMLPSFNINLSSRLEQASSASSAGGQPPAETASKESTESGSGEDSAPQPAPTAPELRASGPGPG